MWVEDVEGAKQHVRKRLFVVVRAPVQECGGECAHDGAGGDSGVGLGGVLREDGGQDLLRGSRVGPHAAREAGCPPEDSDPLPHLLLVGQGDPADGFAQAAAGSRQRLEESRLRGHGGAELRVERVLEDHGVLGGEVSEERHLADPSRTGDLLDGSRVEPVLGEEVECHPLQARVRLFGFAHADMLVTNILDGKTARRSQRHPQRTTCSPAVYADRETDTYRLGGHHADRRPDPTISPTYLVRHPRVCRARR